MTTERDEVEVLGLLVTLQTVGMAERAVYLLTLRDKAAKDMAPERLRLVKREG